MVHGTAPGERYTALVMVQSKWNLFVSKTVVAEAEVRNSCLVSHQKK